MAINPKWRQASVGQAVPSAELEKETDLKETVHNPDPFAMTYGESLSDGPDDDQTIRERLIFGEIANGRYLLTREIGRGGMGVVYEARDAQTGGLVAVKVLAVDPSNAELLGRFVLEARVAASIPHENISRLFDLGVDPRSGAPYMVIELLQGQDLEAVLQARGPLPIDEACAYVMQACSGLAPAHRLNIVHRDVKLSNLFVVDPGGRKIVKVLDFGVSKAPSFGDMTRLTVTGATLGSPVYMAPEQVRNAKSVDARADIWSVGVVLYELLTGLPPFDADTLGELFVRILKHDPLPLRARRPDVPAALEHIVSVTLQKDRERRFPDVVSLQQALAPFLQGPPSAWRPGVRG